MKKILFETIRGNIEHLYTELDDNGIVYISNLVKSRRDGFSQEGDIRFINEIFQTSGSHVFNSIRGIGNVERMQVYFIKDGEYSMPDRSEYYPLWLSDTLEAILDFSSLLSRHVVTCQGLLSLPGCRRQPAHSDYDPEPFRYIPSHLVPLACLVATEEGTSLVGYTRHGVRTRYEIAPGDAIVFRADYVHAGSEYDNRNFRVHAYMDVPGTYNFARNTFLSEFDRDAESEFHRSAKTQRSLPQAAGRRL